MVKRSIEAVSSESLMDIFTRERHYTTTLSRYIQTSDVESIEALLSSVDDTRFKSSLIDHILYEALPGYAHDGNDIVLHFFVNTLDINSYAGWKALIGSCKAGKLEAITTLINRGIDINFQFSGDISPLIHAVMKNQVEAVQLLLNAGANIQAATYFGYTALHFAAEYNLADMTSVLLEHEADIHARNNSGITSLLSAASRKATAVIPVLIAAGANLNDEDDNGGTALLHAIFSYSNDHAVEKIVETVNLLQGAPHQNNEGIHISSYRDITEEYESDANAWDGMWSSLMPPLDNVNSLPVAQISLTGDSSDEE